MRYTSYDNPDIPSERDNASPTSADKYVPEASDCSPLSDTDNWEIGLDLDDLQSTGKISLVAGMFLLQVIRRFRALLLDNVKQIFRILTKIRKTFHISMYTISPSRRKRDLLLTWIAAERT